MNFWLISENFRILKNPSEARIIILRRKVSPSFFQKVHPFTTNQELYPGQSFVESGDYPMNSDCELGIKRGTEEQFNLLIP